MTKHPSRKVINFRHLLGCYTIVIAEDTTFIWAGDFNMTFDIDLDADGDPLNCISSQFQNYYR